MKAQSQQSASIPQVQKINILINKLGLTAHKETLVMSYTGERTTHIRDMTSQEARQLIMYLVRQEPDERKRSLILSLGYQCGLIYGNTPEDKKMNIAKINRFLLERGAVKKELHKLNSEELKKVHRQFEAMVQNRQKTNDNKAVKSLLTEIGIPHDTKPK